MRNKCLVLLCSLLLLPLYTIADNLIIGSRSDDPANATFEKYNDSGGRTLTGNLSIPLTIQQRIFLQATSS
jgi:hypothetical protein